MKLPPQSVLNISVSARYGLTIQMKGNKTADRESGYCNIVIRGISDTTDVMTCTVDTSPGANSTCKEGILKDDTNIGVYTGLYIADCYRSLLGCEKIYMKIDGVVQQEIRNCSVAAFQSTILQVFGINEVST